MNRVLRHPIKELADWQLAYITGIIDGEGCLNLAKQSKRKDISPTIMINMTNSACIHFLHNVTGAGHFYTYVQPKPRKVTYRWVIHGRLEIYLLLRAIQPYSIVKRKQIIVMLEFIERRIQNNLVTARDYELLEEMHELNK